MALMRFDPFRDLVDLRQSINRLFDDNIRLGRTPEGELAQGHMFPVDIKDTPEALLIKAELPGVDRESVKISYADNVLTIKGERRKEEKEEGANFIRVERSFGSFSRAFSVGVPVMSDQIKARLQDGVLEITLPKKKEVKEKEITIDVV